MFLSVIIFLFGIFRCAQAEMSINPVLLTLKPQDKLVKVELVNLGNQKRHFQVSIKSWHQNDGEDQLEPVQEWIISPAIFTIEPSKSQLIRLAPKAKKVQNIEQNFRVCFDEIPQKNSGNLRQVKFNFKISLPLFIETKNQEELPVHAKISNGKLFLSNPNNHHIELAYLSKGDQQIPITGYVLAKSEKTIPLPQLSSPSGWTLSFGHLHIIKTTNIQS